MNENLEYLRRLMIQKEQSIMSSEEQEKIENLKCILEDDNIFFSISMDVAIGIFDFLGVPSDDMLDLYFNLVSPEAYQRLPKDYITISKNK